MKEPKIRTLRPQVPLLGGRVRTLQPTQSKRMTGKGLQARRKRLYARDPRCAHCGRPCLPDEFHLDHVVALVNGGRDVEDNLQLLCLPCHEVKTVADLAQARGGGR